ncbi:MAG TPA: hypothetical protein VIK14_15810 [Ignavibacteria bacterium]
MEKANSPLPHHIDGSSTFEKKELEERIFNTLVNFSKLNINLYLSKSSKHIE